MNQGHTESFAGSSDEASSFERHRSLRSGFARRKAFWDAVMLDERESVSEKEASLQRESKDKPESN